MATLKQKSITDPYETDPAKIADVSTIGGGIKGLIKAGAGGIGNVATAVGRGIKNAALATVAYGSNADKPFESHYEKPTDSVPAIGQTTTAPASSPAQTAKPAIDAELRTVNINPDGSTPQLSKFSDATVPQTRTPLTNSTNQTNIASIANPGAALFKVTGGQTPTGFEPAVTLTKGNAGKFAAMNDARGVVADNPGNRPDLAKTVLSIADTASGTDLTADKGKSPIAVIRGPLDPTTAKAIHDRVDFSAGSVNEQRSIADAKYKDEVAQAVRANAANGFMPTSEQMKSTGMTNADLVSLLTANNQKGRYDKAIAGIQIQQGIDQKGEEVASDAAYKQGLLAIDAPLRTAQAQRFNMETGLYPDIAKANITKTLSEAEKERAQAVSPKNQFDRATVMERLAPQYKDNPDLLNKMVDIAQLQHEGGGHQVTPFRLPVNDIDGNTTQLNISGMIPSNYRKVYDDLWTRYTALINDYNKNRSSIFGKDEQWKRFDAKRQAILGKLKAMPGLIFSTDNPIQG